MSAVVLESSTNGERVQPEIDDQHDTANSAIVLAEVLEPDSALTEIVIKDPQFDPRMHILVREPDGSLKKYRRVKCRPQNAEAIVRRVSQQVWCEHCQQHVVRDAHICWQDTPLYKQLFNAVPSRTAVVAPTRDRTTPSRRLQDALIAGELGVSAERAAEVLPVDYPPVGEELNELSARTLRRLQGPVFQDTGVVLLGPEDVS